MNYANKSFAVTVGGKAYADGWERTFGKGEAAPEEQSTEQQVDQFFKGKMDCECGETEPHVHANL